MTNIKSNKFANSGDALLKFGVYWQHMLPVKNHTSPEAGGFISGGDGVSIKIVTNSSRVRAREDSYLYAGDLEISLNRDEIVRLLMTEKLYGHPSLAIRELLQNAWDALRHRKAIMKRDDGVEWPGGLVEFEHGVNEHGREFVLCVDNGVGMDQRIVKEFLVRAGRSYYRSPEFERERLTFVRWKVYYLL